MSPTINFHVDDVPPIKRGAESMWAKQTSRVKSLRRAAAREPHEPANRDDEVHLDVVVYTDRMDGDLDSFVAGICDDSRRLSLPGGLTWIS